MWGERTTGKDFKKKAINCGRDRFKCVSTEVISGFDFKNKRSMPRVNWIKSKTLNHSI